MREGQEETGAETEADTSPTSITSAVPPRSFSIFLATDIALFFSNGLCVCSCVCAPAGAIFHVTVARRLHFRQI